MKTTLIQLQSYLAEKAKEVVDAGYGGVFLDNFGLELLFRRKDKYSGPSVACYIPIAACAVGRRRPEHGCRMVF